MKLHYEYLYLMLLVVSSIYCCSNSVSKLDTMDGNKAVLGVIVVSGAPLNIAI